MASGRSKPKVSVCVVTYNQEKFIRQCLQSIVDQETDFDFEVIVSDDCSKDGTAAIVKEFAEKYPRKVKAILRKRNVGPTQNYLGVHKLARGEYVAHVDGDDYCLPGKLKRLAEHLDREPECAIVWHRMIVLNEKGQAAVGMPIVPIRNFTGTDRLYARDLAKYYGMTGCHSGSMYRAAAKKVHARQEETIDYFSTLALCIDGRYASYIEEPYGVYRFYATEMTITRTKGSLITGRCKLSLMRDFLASNPELRGQFAAQCLFELMLRTFLRYPLKWDYFKMLLACRTVPSISDVMLIARVFLANRHTKLQQAFSSGVQPAIQY